MPQCTCKLKLQCKIKSNTTKSKQACCKVLASEVFGRNYESTCKEKKWNKQFCIECKVLKLCFMGLQYTALPKSEVLKGHWVIKTKTNKQTRINGSGNPSSNPVQTLNSWALGTHGVDNLVFFHWNAQVQVSSCRENLFTASQKSYKTRLWDKTWKHSTETTTP